MLQRYAKIAQTVALLSFGLPWVTVSCGEQPVAKLSGINIVTGSATVRNPITGILESHTATPSLIVCAALLLVIIGLVASWIFARRNAAKLASVCSGSAILLILLQLFLSDALSTQRKGAFETVTTGAADVKTAFGVWLTIAALGFSTFAFRKASHEGEENFRPRLPARIAGIAILLGVLCLPRILQSNEASATPSRSASLGRADQSMAMFEQAEETPIHVEPLKEADTANIEGASCWAVNEKGSTVFASDGKAMVRLNGKLVILDEQDGMIGGDALRSKDGRVIVTFAKRFGKFTKIEEGVAILSKMTVFAAGQQKSIPVTKSCGA